MPYAAFLAGVAPVTSSNTFVKLVTKAGVVTTVLLDATTPNCNIGPLEWDLHGPSTASFSLPTSHANAALVGAKEEVQFWRNGSCIWWGYVERADIDDREARFQCAGLPRYFDFRQFGKANRDNLLTNPQFESDGTGWTASGVTATYPTDIKILGSKSARLEQATEGVDTYLQQVVTVTSGSIGELMTLAAWFQVGVFGWNGPAYGNRGLYLELSDGTSRAVEYVEIDDFTPRGTWTRAEVTIWIPPLVTWDVVCRLYAPSTFIWWDACSLTKMESFSHYQTDQASIVAAMVDYAQDRGPFVHGKSDLLINATAATCPPTGIVRDYHQQFAEHQNIGRSIADFGDIDDGVDFSVEHTGTVRNFHTWYPARGTNRTATVTITDAQLVAGSNGWRFDGEQAASSVVVVGDGDGPDREEGGAIDSSLFGSTTFETVISARPNTPIDRLGPLATEALQAFKRPESAVVTVAEPEKLLLELVHPGDTITADVDQGALQITGAWRVVAKRFEPVTEALTFELNPA